MQNLLGLLRQQLPNTVKAAVGHSLLQRVHQNLRNTQAGNILRQLRKQKLFGLPCIERPKRMLRQRTHRLPQALYILLLRKMCQQQLSKIFSADSLHNIFRCQQVIAHKIRQTCRQALIIIAQYICAWRIDTKRTLKQRRHTPPVCQATNRCCQCRMMYKISRQIALRPMPGADSGSCGAGQQAVRLCFYCSHNYSPINKRFIIVCYRIPLLLFLIIAQSRLQSKQSYPTPLKRIKNVATPLLQ